MLTDYTTGPQLTVNPNILSHGHSIERVSLRVQFFDTVSFAHRIGLVTSHGHGFSFLDTFNVPFKAKIRVRFPLNHFSPNSCTSLATFCQAYRPATFRRRLTMDAYRQELNRLHHEPVATLKPKQRQSLLTATHSHQRRDSATAGHRLLPLGERKREPNGAPIIHRHNRTGVLTIHVK